MEQRIRFFRKKARFAFGKYLPSELLTKKRHALDRLCEAITEVEGIGSLHGGIYELCHKRFKLYYGRSSRPRRVAMDQIIFMQNDENVEHFEQFIGSLVFSITVNGCAGEACKRDSKFLACNGAKSSSFEL